MQENHAKLIGCTQSFYNGKFSFYLTIDMDIGQPDPRRLRVYINPKYPPSILLANVFGHFVNDDFLRSLTGEQLQALNEENDLICEVSVNILTEDRIWNGKSLTDVKGIIPRREVPKPKVADKPPVQDDIPMQTTLPPIDPSEVDF